MADKLNGDNFDAFDLRVLSTISHQIAEIYRGIISQERDITQKQLAQEIDIAAEIQKKILPEIAPHFGTHQLAAFNQPAKVVGGDFYDFFKFDDRKYGILIADVSGKGIPAALFMGLARNVIRAEKRIHSSPSSLLYNANNLICKDSEHGMFVTVFYAVIDAHNSIITYSSGGHNNQLLVKKESKEVISLNTQGKVLGMMEDVNFEEKIVMFDPGDVLILYTDGIIEALGGEDLNIIIGEKALEKIAISNIDKSPDEIIEELKKSFYANENNLEYRDDFTVFVIKF